MERNLNPTIGLHARNYFDWKPNEYYKPFHVGNWEFWIKRNMTEVECPIVLIGGVHMTYFVSFQNFIALYAETLSSGDGAYTKHSDQNAII